MAYGRNTHRWKDNEMEERFARIWEAYDEEHHILEYMLSSRTNEREPVDENTQEDIATIIQWLGSPVGLSFLEKVLGVEVRRLI